MTGKRQRKGGLVALCARIAVCLALAVLPSPPLAAETPTPAAPVLASSFQLIDRDRLFGAQQALLDSAAQALPPVEANRARTFVIGVAAGGSQALFGREADAAAKVLASRFGEKRVAILSNARGDLARVPLATIPNLDTLLHKGVQRFDARRDLAVVYLAAHGYPQAALLTDLPDSSQLTAISARDLAAMLDMAGVTRRIVVVSACFSGSWIEPLATPDTIVITAAAADRTSFGCDDKRAMTVFGESFVAAMSRNVPLASAFDDLRYRIAAEEGRLGAWPSLPQAFVGEHMRTLWTGAKPR